MERAKDTFTTVELSERKLKRLSREVEVSGRNDFGIQSYWLDIGSKIVEGIKTLREKG